MEYFNFGKYKGCRVANVVEVNPAYAVWAHWNVGFFKLSNEQLRAAEINIATRRSAHRRGMNWTFDTDDEDDWMAWW